MKRVISLQYGDATLLEVAFKQENRGGVFVGVALVSDEVAERFQDRDDFEVEDVTVAETLGDFPKDFPLLAPQKAALAAAGLDTLDKLKAHDFEANKIQGIGGATITKIGEYLNPKPPPAPRASRRAEKADKSTPVEPPADPPPADPPTDPPAE